MDPTNPSNNPMIETMWATKAFAHADTYERILNTVKDKSKLKLTRIDDQIYEHFRSIFPDLNVDEFDIEFSKTPEQKKLWSQFSEKYDDEIVKDFNMATLMRLRAREPFSEENSCIVFRVQFHAIEIARNREGFNNLRRPEDETE